MEAEINGVRLFYRDEGPRDGIPVVLIHGFPFSQAMWEPQIRALAEEFRVVAYDMRGLGQSGVGDGQYTMELYVDDLSALLDFLVIERAVLCGLSMGGYVALRMAQREADRVRALVLCDTRSQADADEAKLGRAAAIRAIKQGGLAGFAEDFVGKVFAPASLAGAAAARRQSAVSTIRSIIAASQPLGVCGALLAMAGRTDTTGTLAGIRVPALVLVGEHDALTPPAQARALAAAIPGSEMSVIAGAGHLSSLENPEEFNQRLLGFLRRLSGRGGRPA
ncbi:MAG TPA: alpha/beta hydrolase [Elusimicrobia bacterium]|nr:alpha/beta hydrolase [Elusimicrobiota bacterium]HBT61669.1 alpha/beta hydrolase [Elusimicrobiota bacterium]